jgi:hypothetical protein
MRAWAEGRGLGDPPTLRAWGGIVAKAARLGIIRRVGFDNSLCQDRPGTNTSIVSLWISEIYRGQEPVQETLFG